MTNVAEMPAFFSMFLMDVKIEKKKLSFHCSIFNDHLFMSDTTEYRFANALQILIAEDNDMNKLLLSSVLGNWGLEYKIATNGVEVIELMQNHDFDLILMDIQMPEKDGVEATVEIRNFLDERKKNIPIIALTANAVKGEEKRYFDVGMNGFLTKPFNEKDLFEIVNEVLKAHELKFPDRK